jgi:hypothetical protein
VLVGRIRNTRYCTALFIALIAHAQDSAQTATPAFPVKDFTPMTARAKIEYNLIHSVQPSDFFQTALGSGLAQWRNAPDEWGQGWDAYGTRYGSRFAQHLVKRALMTTTQVIVGEDPRRIRSERTGLWHRTQDAVKYTFVSRRDGGSRGFAYNRVIGAYAAGFISRAWHPSRLHTFPEGLSAGTISLGVETGMSVLNEFMPDILHKLHLRRR